MTSMGWVGAGLERRSRPLFPEEPTFASVKRAEAGLPFGDGERAVGPLLRSRDECVCPSIGYCESSGSCATR